MLVWLPFVVSMMLPTSSRLTPDEMFRLQVPFRYKVSVAEIGIDGLGRWELQVTDYYCDVLDELHIVQDPRFSGPPSLPERRSIRGDLKLRIDDALWFPEDRYHRGGIIIDGTGDFLLVVKDRQEHVTLWPPPKTPDF